MRSRSSLAMMISASQVSHQLHALEAPVGVRNVLVCGSPGVHHLTSHWPTSSPLPAELLELAPRYAGAVGASERNSSPVVMIAQAMRASLLASATVTSRAGRRCRSRWSRQPMDRAVFPEPAQARCRSEDEQASQIRIALFGNPAEPFLSAAGVLSRNQTEPRREVATGAEHRGIGNMRGERRADQRADAWDGLERLRRRARPLPGFDLLVDRRQMRVDRPQLIRQNLHDRERRPGLARGLHHLRRASGPALRRSRCPFFDDAEFGELTERPKRVRNRRALLDQQLP